MITRIWDKLFLALATLMLMAGTFEDASTMMVLAVLLTALAITFTDIFRQNIAIYILSVIVVSTIFIHPSFAAAVIPCCYGIFATTSLGSIESHIYRLLIDRVKADGVANKANRGIKGLSTGEKLSLAVALLVLLIMLIISGILAGRIPVLMSLIAVAMAVKTALAENMEKNYFDKYDRARTQQLEAEETKNRIEKQSEDNAYMAMLQERNRIAREIHDNVGHMLTRAIVQMQAVKVINKDENIKPHLESVDETINSAMLNIRRSVHELHDESIDLSIMLNEIVKTLPESFKVDCRTSIESAADTELKNTILSIVREAVTNIAKYSKGDLVKVELIEHAAFWRVLVFDNGRNEKMDYGRQLQIRDGGMGLMDIVKRAERVGGTANISSDDNGFTVLVIIPKGGR